ncbi:MAG TPA: Do family serine endopeptidase, partial [Stellaceae bacterium]|nr:Do family serine endopeptidase [Stellaceae bacterium]
ENIVQAFRGRGRSIAASWALFAIIAAPALAQPGNAPTAPSAAPPQESLATPGAPPQPESGAAAAPVPALQPETPAAAPAPPRPAETPFADLFAQMTARLVGSVVNVSTQTTAPAAMPPKETAQNSPGRTLDEVFREFLGDKAAPGAPGTRVASLGSGFIIDPSGLIVTNHHVIASAQQVTVTLSDETVLPAQVVGRDPITDLALLKVEPKTPLPAVTWGDSGKTRPGDWVLTIGNPFGLGGSVAAGIISAVARDIRSSPYDDYLQTDAAMNRGNSGGPMFNIAGEVIGINTVIYSPSGGSIGIGFALPSALARPIIEQLKATGKVERGWIGARVQPVTEDLAETVGLDKPRGAMIAAVDAGSPAAQAKLQPGDVILSYDGQPIERSRQLPRIIAATPPNKPVKLTFWRDGREAEVELKTAALDPNRPAPPPPEPEKPKPPATVDAFGLKLAKITPELRKQFSLPDGAKGAVITEVPPNSAGAAQGLRPGDLVVAIGQAPLAGPEQVPQLAAAAKKGNQKRVLVRIEQREGNTRFVALPTEAG